MSDETQYSHDESGTNASAHPRITGYLVFLVIAGASIGRQFAQVQPIDQFKGMARRMAESQTLDQMIPFIVVGAICGLIIGFIAEPFLPKWKPAFWLYGIFAMSIIWGTIGMPPWFMP